MKLNYCKTKNISLRIPNILLVLTYKPLMIIHFLTTIIYSLMIVIFYLHLIFETLINCIAYKLNIKN